jgi:CRP-like cAMP-binding protein
MSSLDESSLSPSCEYQENLEILRQTYFFSGLPLESLKIFAYLCTREKFREGEFLFRQGEDDGEALWIISGRAQLERSTHEASQAIRICAAGDFIGGLTLLGETPRLYSLRALQETVGLVLTRDKFAKTLEQFPGQRARIFRTVVGAISGWEERFLESMPSECGGCAPKLGVSLL